MPIPTREGVSPSCIALPAGTWRTILDFLAERLPIVSRENWIGRMEAGDVLRGNGRPVAPDAPYRAHEKIYYYRSLVMEQPIPFEEAVLHRDEFIVAADKPHFLPVTPSGRYLQETLLVRLKRKLGIDTLTPMHRIDRETAGVVLFTIQPHTRDRYQSLFRDKAVEKYYEAIAPHRPTLTFPRLVRNRLVEGDSFMTMRQADGVPNAETLVELLEVQGVMARYGLQPATGQKHQLRAHLSGLGIPIVNDRIYPVLHPEIAEGETDFTKPMKLLAKSIAFIDPVTGEQRQFASRQQLSF